MSIMKTINMHGIASGVIAAILLAGLAQNAPAAPITVTDSFDSGAGLNSLGTNWTVLIDWFYKENGRAYNGLYGGDSLAEYAGTSVGTNPFSVQAEVAITASDNQFVGLAFNIQDASNYYAVRWETNSGGYYQILGGPTLWVTGYATYTAGSLMKVTGDGAGNFQLTLGGAGPISFSDPAFSGGGLGLYVSANPRGGVSFDNFSATYTPVPEPSLMALIGLGGLWLWRRRANAPK